MTALPLRRRFAILAHIAFAALAALTVLAAPGAPAIAEVIKIAVFPFEFIDSGEATPGNPGIDAAEKNRLNLIGVVLMQRLEDSGLYQNVELAGAAKAIAQSPPLRDCQSCADEIARAAGAQIAIVGYVQKVSNLILNINVKLSDALTGKGINAVSVDIRGNTDESWTRGIEWIVKNRLLPKSQP